MKSAFVFEGTDKYPTCHAGTICELENGDLLAAWYAGEYEGSPDSVISGSRLRSGEQNWDPPVVWVNVANRAAGNPRLFIGPDKGVWLISPVNYGEWCDGGTRMFMKRSYDSGHTWTDLEILTRRRRILGKNKPLFIMPNIWILPMEYEGLGDIVFIRSVNDGKTWKTINCDSGGAYLDQPTIVQLSNGDLMAYMRSWEGHIYVTYSHDLGLTWEIPHPTELPNNNSGIDMVKLSSGKLVLVYNPTALGVNGDLTSSDVYGVGVALRFAHNALKKAGNDELQRKIFKIDTQADVHTSGLLRWGPRTPLVVGVSDDEGHTWRTARVLEDAPGEYSYPAVIQGSDGAIHVFYTHQRTRMKHVRLEESELG